MQSWVFSVSYSYLYTCSNVKQPSVNLHPVSETSTDASYSFYSFQIVLGGLFCFCFNIDPKSSFKPQRDLNPGGC